VADQQRRQAVVKPESVPKPNPDAASFTEFTLNI